MVLGWGREDGRLARRPTHVTAWRMMEWDLRRCADGLQGIFSSIDVLKKVKVA